MPLATVADDGDLLALEHIEIGVRLVKHLQSQSNPLRLELRVVSCELRADVSPLATRNSELTYDTSRSRTASRPFSWPTMTPRAIATSPVLTISLMPYGRSIDTIESTLSAGPVTSTVSAP